MALWARVRKVVMSTEVKSGKGKYGNRTEGIIVHRVDAEGLTKVANEIYNLIYGDEFYNIKVWGDLVVGYDKAVNDWDRHNNLILICSEGVGWKADDYGRINVPLHLGEWNDTYVEISAKVIAKFITEESVDLADHIRVFGDRLENNFSIWAYHLTRTELPKEES